MKFFIFSLSFLSLLLNVLIIDHINLVKMSRRQRFKTEESTPMTELKRQKSIYSNLSWQVRQRDKKISFLQRYFEDLQRVISKQNSKNEILNKKMQRIKDRKIYSYAYRYPTEPNKQQPHNNNYKIRILHQQLQRSEQYSNE